MDQEIQYCELTMTKASLTEIAQILTELIQGKKTREQIAFWATNKQTAHDSDDLEFEPMVDKRKIWRAIKYLMGVDLKDIDGSYLHSSEDFQEFKKEIDQ